MRIATRSRSELDLSKIDSRRADATTEQEIDRQISQDPYTAPVLTADEIRLPAICHAKRPNC